MDREKEEGEEGQEEGEGGGEDGGPSSVAFAHPDISFSLQSK